MNDVERIRAANPLAEVAGEVTELRRNGGTWVGLCPLHDETDASFNVYPSDSFYCFGCDVGGDVFTLVEYLHGVNFRGGLEFLADRAGIELNGGPPDPEEIKRRGQLERKVADAAERLEPRHIEYLRGRGLTEKTIQRLRIGVTARGNYVLPVLRYGRPVYLIKHDPGGDPRYRYPRGESRPLLGVEELSGGATTYLTEGYFDWAVLNQAGLSAMALLGSSAGHHVDALAQADDLVLLLDGDEAGQSAAQTLARQLYPTARIAPLPDGMDPNDLAQQHGNGLTLAVRRLEQNAKDALDLQLARFAGTENFDELTAAYGLVARLPGESMAEDVAIEKIHEAAKGHGVRKKTIRHEVERTRKEELSDAARTDADRTKSGEPEPEKLLEEGREVLEADDQLARVRQCLRRDFYFAGDTSAAELMWLVLHSRHLERPVNVLLHAPSAAGKSYTLHVVSALHPDEATYDLTSSSERALVYSEEPTQHRYVVVAEAAGLHRDGIGATIIRELAWGDRGIRYETVDKVDGELKARLIEKPGPTGLITTTTKDLDPEVSTRLLRVSVTDSPSQTREVFRSLARKAELESIPEPEVDAFHAAAEWLDVAGERKVVVPFASDLAELVPDNDVRLRRDFEQILTVVRIHAFVHQRRRERTDTGAVVACEADYRAAHRLLAGVLAVTLDDVTDAVRETVEKVVELTEDLDEEEGLSRGELADALGLSGSAVSYRVKQADDYIRNLEDRAGYPARYRPGEPLPEARPVLPAPTKLFNSSDSVDRSTPPIERGSPTVNTSVESPSGTPRDVKGPDSTPPRASDTSLTGTSSRTDRKKSEGGQTVERLEGGRDGESVARGTGEDDACPKCGGYLRHDAQPRSVCRLCERQNEPDESHTQLEVWM